MASAKEVAADKAVADKAVADKLVADKLVADKAIADKFVADKEVADKLVASDEDKPEMVLPEGWLMLASGAYLVDPFQGTKFVEGVPTPTKKSSWVDSQVEAGILKEV